MHITKRLSLIGFLLGTCFSCKPASHSTASSSAGTVICHEFSMKPSYLCTTPPEKSLIENAFDYTVADFSNPKQIKKLDLHMVKYDHGRTLLSLRLERFKGPSTKTSLIVFDGCIDTKDISGDPFSLHVKALRFGAGRYDLYQYDDNGILQRSGSKNIGDQSRYKLNCTP